MSVFNTTGSYYVERAANDNDILYLQNITMEDNTVDGTKYFKLFWTHELINAGKLSENECDTIIKELDKKFNNSVMFYKKEREKEKEDLDFLTLGHGWTW